jgi:hypothetical protein
VYEIDEKLHRPLCKTSRQLTVRNRIAVGVRVESKLISGKKRWMVWTGYTEQLPFAGCGGNGNLTADCVKQRTVSPAEQPVFVSLQHSVSLIQIVVVMEQMFMKTQKQTDTKWSCVIRGQSALRTSFWSSLAYPIRYVSSRV